VIVGHADPYRARARPATSGGGLDGDGAARGWTEVRAGGDSYPRDPTGPAAAAAAARHARNISERRFVCWWGKDISEFESFTVKIQDRLISGVALIFLLAGVASSCDAPTVGGCESINGAQQGHHAHAVSTSVIRCAAAMTNGIALPRTSN